MNKVAPISKTEKRVHSIPFPRVYKEIVNVVKKFHAKEGTLKSLVYEGKIREKKRVLPCATAVVLNYKKIKEVLISLNVFEDNPKFEEVVAVVLASELIRKKEKLQGESKPILTINQYMDKLLTAISCNELENKRDDLPRYVRINTLIASQKEVYDELFEEGWEHNDYDKSISYSNYLQNLSNLGEKCFVEDYHISNLLVFPPRTSFFESNLYKSSSIILQDKASCLPTFLSGIVKYERVIDGCAAPGNKTSYLAAVMQNTGEIIAIDKDRKRCQLMEKLLKARNVKNIQVINRDFTNIDPSDHKDFDLILLDPSCSGSGTGHFGDVDQTRIDKLSSFQSEILSHALRFPGVRSVIYSTCSVHETENELVVERVLRNVESEFELEHLGDRLAGWKTFGLDDYPFGSYCIRTAPEVDRCQGFFVAKFIRKNDGRKIESNLSLVPENDGIVSSPTLDEEKSLHTPSNCGSKKKKRKYNPDAVDGSPIKSFEPLSETTGCQEESVFIKKPKKKKKRNEISQ